MRAPHLAGESGPAPRGLHGLPPGIVAVLCLGAPRRPQRPAQRPDDGPHPGSRAAECLPGTHVITRPRGGLCREGAARDLQDPGGRPSAPLPRWALRPRPGRGACGRRARPRPSGPALGAPRSRPDPCGPWPAPDEALGRPATPPGFGCATAKGPLAIRCACAQRAGAARRPGRMRR